MKPPFSATGTLAIRVDSGINQPQCLRLPSAFSLLAGRQAVVKLSKPGRFGLLAGIVPPKATRRMLSPSSPFARLLGSRPKQFAVMAPALWRQLSDENDDSMSEFFRVGRGNMNCIYQVIIFQACPSGRSCKTTVYSRIPWEFVLKCRLLSQTRWRSRNLYFQTKHPR